MEVIGFQKEVLKGFVEKKVFFKITHHSPDPLPPLHPPVMGDGKFLPGMGKKPGIGGVDLIMKFFRSLYVVGRGVLVPYCMKSPLYWLPSFSYFV